MFLVSKTAFLLGIAQIGGGGPLDHLDFDTFFYSSPPKNKKN